VDKSDLQELLAALYLRLNGYLASGYIAHARVIGLAVPSFNAPFMPCVKLGYRLAFEHWGRGYATEGARAAIAFGFATLGPAEIVAMTAVGNERSRRVMERVGMRHNAADDFDHPNIVAGHSLRRHVLYRLTAPDWAVVAHE
jgi:RimJ/RimL family protein N-acetyltransferase